MLTKVIIAALMQASAPPPLPPPPVWCDPFLVFFDAGSAAVPLRQQQVLDNIASVREQIRSHITVVGYADASGPADYNLRLSRRRAEAVRAELVARGIPNRLIVTEGHGEGYPLIATGDDSTEPQNRRVQVCFY